MNEEYIKEIVKEPDGFVSKITLKNGSVMEFADRRWGKFSDLSFEKTEVKEPKRIKGLIMWSNNYWKIWKENARQEALHFPLKEKYTKAINEFKKLAKGRNIPKHRIIRNLDGYQIVFKEIRGDVIVNRNVANNDFGERKAKFETYRFPWDNDDISVMTVEELIDELEKFEEERNERLRKSNG